MRTTDAEPGVAPARWGFADLAVAFVVAQVASFLGFLALAAYRGESAADLDVDGLPIGQTALLQVPLWIGLALVPIVATYRKGRGPVHELGCSMVPRDVPLGLAIGVACQLVLVPLVSWPVLRLSSATAEDLEEPARLLTDRAHGGGLVVLALVVVVGAPLAEELFFRGMLQRAVGRHLGTVATVAVTAIAFGISHFQPLQFPALAAFGVVLSLLVLRSGRLGPAMWAHAGFNATTIALLVAQR